MGTLLEILKLAKEAVLSFVAQRTARGEVAWDQVIAATDKLNELTTLHVKAIGAVTGPLLEKGDIVETSQRYNALANNPDFPQGYGFIRGVLEAARQIKPFNDTATREKIQSVLDRLSEFQSGAFMLAWDSYQIADAIRLSAELVTSPNSPNARLGEASSRLLASFNELADDGDRSQAATPATRSDLATLVTDWCNAWQRHVQRTLYGGRGLSYAIGQLKLEQFA